MAKKILSGNGWSFEPAASSAKEKIPSLPDDKQKANIKLEKRVRGKEVTVITGFILFHDDRKSLAAALRKACGSGGSDAEGAIEIQGDHRDKVRNYLGSKGWKVS